MRSSWRTRKVPSHLTRAASARLGATIATSSAASAQSTTRPAARQVGGDNRSRTSTAASYPGRGFGTWSRFEPLCDSNLDHVAGTLAAMGRRMALAGALLALICLAAPGGAMAGGETGGAGKSAAQRLIEADTERLGAGFHLNIPGEPLGDTCVYARDFAKLKEEGKAPAVTYAHVAREKGRPGLAVQYWLFWYFNQFNDLHEGDWEGMQVVFDASDPRRALAEGPSEVGLFQHGGGEKAAWSDGKVEKEGTHPVVYPAAGSHATFYDAAVYVENGRKGSGVGCDNTSAPHERLALRPIHVPTSPGSDSPYRWLHDEGRGGQFEKGFNNGPTGPANKDRWLAPMTWMEEIRSTSPRLPAGSVMGPTVTKSFCGAVEEVTSFLNHTQDTPWVLPLILIALLALPVSYTHLT